MKLHRGFSFLLAFFVSIATVAVTAQSAPAKSFEVASVKTAAPLDMAKLAQDFQSGKMPRLGAHVEGDRAEYIYMSLRDLILIAYKVKAFQITGPAWLGSERFDIAATLPDGATKDDVPAMLQNLLQERFKLTSHFEQQEHKVLALVAAKGGPKLKDAPAAPAPIDDSAPLKPGETKIDSPDGPIRFSRNSDGSTTMNMGERGTMRQTIDMQNQSLRLDFSTVTMSGFADMLTAFMQMSGSGMQVIDKTELKGNYQATVEISFADLMANARAQGIDVPGQAPPGSSATPAAAASDPSGSSTLVASLQSMGLKMEERKAQVQQLVIDHIEKTPTEN